MRLYNHGNLQICQINKDTLEENRKILLNYSEIYLLRRCCRCRTGEVIILPAILENVF